MTGSCHCGAAQWTLEGDPGVITACNCTVCRRYGVLWAYDYEHERIRVSGPTTGYIRPDSADPTIEFRFCPTCGCVVCWRGLHLQLDGRRRMGVNIRLASPEAVGDLLIEHLDGLDTFEPLPDDGHRVRDLWF